jgi:23S rRNA (guanosine2251-2'-O)-methyltransferase
LKKQKQEDFIFGIRAVIEAIRSGREVDRVLITSKPESQVMTELFPLVRMHEIPFQYVPYERLNKITRKNHQGVIAFISQISYSPLEEIVASAFENGKDPLIIMLDQVSDVRNFGAIARSAECLGFTGIVIPYRGAARINADAVKTSAGALMNIPVARVRSMEHAVGFLKNSGLQVVSVTEKSEKFCYDQKLTGPLVLILGSEEKGISKGLIDLSDSQVRIPMSGMTSSLNVSVAASVLMYEVVRQSALSGLTEEGADD